MRVIVAIVLIMSVNFLRAQNEITSFYFSEPQPANSENIFGFDASVCGRYLFEDDTLSSLIVEKDSIYTKYTILTFLTEKELKNDSKYRVENDLLFGIKKGEGLPFIQRRDTLYTVIIQTETIFSIRENEIKRINDQYFMNYREGNGMYSTQILKKTGRGVSIFYLDHEIVLDELLNFKNTETKMVNGFKTYISTPTDSELDSFVRNNGFRDQMKYVLPEKL